MITFRDIKQNYSVHVLDKRTMTVTQSKVQSVTAPHMDYNQHNGMSQMVVDVTLDIEGRVSQYTIRDTLSVAYAGTHLVLATEKAGLIGEIEAMKNTAEQVLQSVDRQREVLAKANELLGKLDPATKGMELAEERLKSLEESTKRITGLEESVSRIEKLVSDLAGQFKS